MLIQALSIFNFDHGQPMNSLDLTGAFGPSSGTVVIGLAAMILVVAVLTAVVDSWWSERRTNQSTVSTQVTEPPVTASCSCKAA
jgi:hypothetical protein